MPPEPPNENPGENPALDHEEPSWLAQYYTSSKSEETVEMGDGEPAQALAHLFQMPTEKYLVCDEVGAGGMKTVFKAHDLNASRDVAMAKLRELKAPPRRVRRFVREARITAALEHPNIVPVHEIGMDESGNPYFTMKLLGGETLHSILKKLGSGDPDYPKKYPLSRLLQIFQSVCNAVAFAHSRGIIHLDLKPANIQVGGFGEVLVLDWGLAKILAQSDALPVWLREVPMAPEQAQGEEASLDERTDIYALGAILSTILTLEPPAVQSAKDCKCRRIPQGLSAVVMKAVALDPNKRYPSVKELAAEVQAFVGGYATSAQQASALILLWLLIKRHSVVSSLAAASLLLILSILSFALVRIHRSERMALDALAGIKAEQESKRQIGLIAAPRVLQQAEEQIRSLDYDQALQSLDYAVALDGDLESAWWWKGCLHLGCLEFDQAEDAFDHALKSKFGAGKNEDKGTDKISRIEQVARKYAVLARANSGALPKNKLAEFLLDVSGAGQTGWWYRNAALGLFFQHQNRTAPDIKLVELGLSILNQDAKDFPPGLPGWIQNLNQGRKSGQHHSTGGTGCDHAGSVANLRYRFEMAARHAADLT